MKWVLVEDPEAMSLDRREAPPGEAAVHRWCTNQSDRSRAIIFVVGAEARWFRPKENGLTKWDEMIPLPADLSIEEQRKLVESLLRLTA